MMQYSDSSYVAALVTALGNAFSITRLERLDPMERSTAELFIKTADAAIDKAITMDRLIPTYHNVVTRAGLQVWLSRAIADNAEPTEDDDGWSAAERSKKLSQLYQAGHPSLGWTLLT
jgi:hypothetical protein